MKLIRTERSVAYYNVVGEDIVGEYNIDSISFEELSKIVIPPIDDPELIEGYVLNEIQLEKINDHLINKIIPEYRLYYYVLECTGIYDYISTKN